MAPTRWLSSLQPRLKHICSILFSFSAITQSWTPVSVKGVIELGPQHNPDVTGISRDGGATTLLNGNIIWLYDDTECRSSTGTQLSFVSNTAAYSKNPNGNISIVRDFGVVSVGKDKSGTEQYAILADKTVGTGGWIPFENDELDFNQEKVGVERVAIWPGTNPTPISVQSAFLFAPLVYVDAEPEDPSKRYQSRGITLISIKAPSSGPVATRLVDLLFPGDTISFGGFAAVMGAPSLDTASFRQVGDRDIYLLGYTDSGLQLARITLNDIKDPSGYSFFHPNQCKFTKNAPSLSVTDPSEIYMQGSFASGSVFYSPYFRTFMLVYFDELADSTFYIRYLDLSKPSCGSTVWIEDGKNGSGVGSDDAEALVWYSWSEQQALYASPPGKGGFNYAGFVHPEFFNRQYLSPSLYDDGVPAAKRINNWYGATVLAESEAGGDGKHLLLSWVSQEKGGFGTGVYQVMLAKVEFDDIPWTPGGGASTPAVKPSTSTASAKSSTLIAYGIGDLSGATFLRSAQAEFGRRSAGWREAIQLMVLLGFWCLVATTF